MLQKSDASPKQNLNYTSACRKLFSQIERDEWQEEDDSVR